MKTDEIFVYSVYESESDTVSESMLCVTSIQVSENVYKK